LEPDVNNNKIDNFTVADKSIAYIANHDGIADIEGSEKFVPHGPPPGLLPSNHPIWKIGGLRALAPTIRRFRGIQKERRSGRLTSAVTEAGLLFVHIPKNMGTSVAEALYGNLLGHHSMQFLSAALGKDVVGRTLSFAIIRRPEDRLRSAFSFLKFNAVEDADVRYRATYLSDIPDFETFLLRLEDTQFRKQAMRWHHFREQCAFVADPKGELMVDVLVSMDDITALTGILENRYATPPEIGHTNASRKVEKMQIDPALMAEIYGADVRLYEHLQKAPAGAARTPAFHLRHG